MNGVLLEAPAVSFRRGAPYQIKYAYMLLEFCLHRTLPYVSRAASQNEASDRLLKPIFTRSVLGSAAQTLLLERRLQFSQAKLESPPIRMFCGCMRHIQKEVSTIDDFNYDCMEKKRIASGSKHMKRGSKSKKCTLPSDLLTAAQIKKKNGKVINMDMAKPTSLRNFKTWPTDIQKEYLTRYINEFGCTIADLAQIFGCSYSAFRKHLTDIEFDTSVFAVGKRMSKENRFRFRQWLSTYYPEFQSKETPRVEAPDSEPVPEVPNQEDHPADSTNERDSLMGTPRVCMDFTGLLNVHQIANTLLSVANGKRVKVSVVIEEAEE